MANEGAVASAFPTSRHPCEDCGLFFESAKSLEVHLQYHKENLLSKWATQAQSAQNDLENNNNTKLKREAAVAAPADSSDAMITKPSPELPARATPDSAPPFGHPATPQSYHSAPSPYQTPEQAGFSPGQYPPYAAPPFAPEQPAPAWEQHYAPDYAHKGPRFHPYAPDRSAHVSSSSPGAYGRPLSQPTPSPSPKQCDKCGFVCESAAQLHEHCSSSHPPAPHFHRPQPYPPKHFFAPKVKEEQEEAADILDLDSQKVVHPGDENGSFDPLHDGPNPHPVSAMLPWPKQEMYAHQLNGEHKMYPQEHKGYDQKPFPHDPKHYPHDQKLYAHEQKLFPGVQHENKNFIHQDQKLYRPHQMGMGDYQSGVSTSGQDLQPPYRPFDSPAGPQISSTQASNPAASAPPIAGKGANWKSNEARRPKTYNCTACNKWFTSSGHLKRHYNTTLHKNAVRSSGHPDPASLPISSHHHPARDPTHARSQSTDAAHSPLPEDARSPDHGDGHAPAQFQAQGFDRAQHAAMALKGPYMHQQPPLGNQLLGNNPLADHPLPHQLGSHPLAVGNQPPGLGDPLDPNNHQSKPPGQPGSVTNSVGSPPNGQAGPSVQTNHHSRGLLSISTSNTIVQALPQGTPPITAHSLPPFSHLPGSPYSPRPSDHPGHTVQDPTHTALYLGQNFQQSLGPNYPNGMSPHVMDTASNSLPTTSLVTIGEMACEQYGLSELDASPAGPLPSFAQFQSHRYGIILPNFSPMHNVGGSAPGDSPNVQSYVILDSPYTLDPLPDESSADSDDYKLQSLQCARPEPPADVANKENYEALAGSPSPGLQPDYDNNGSPSISSTVGPPLGSSNKQAGKAAGAEVHKCFECDKLFNKACYLTQHNKSFHSGAKPFKCVRCGKRFPNDASYEEHYSKHAGDKPFKCELCPKQFNHKTDLRRHMCLHSGEKPFSCQECGKGFIRKDHMLKHSDTHRKKGAAAAAL